MKSALVGRYDYRGNVPVPVPVSPTVCVVAIASVPVFVSVTVSALAVASVPDDFRGSIEVEN